MMENRKIASLTPILVNDSLVKVFEFQYQGVRLITPAKRAVLTRPFSGSGLLSGATRSLPRAVPYRANLYPAVIS
jgi:hypothetical protein